MNIVAILNVECDEPEGKVDRCVYPMPLTPENIRKLYVESSKFPTLFSDDFRGNFKEFVEQFVSEENGTLKAHGLFWVVDNFVGVFYLTHITPVEATCHYTFFDRRQRGRENLTKELIKYVFRRFGFRRLNAEIPCTIKKHAFGFTYALGFKSEGRKRKATKYKGEWVDVATFGLLREEALDANLSAGEQKNG